MMRPSQSVAHSEKGSKAKNQDRYIIHNLAAAAVTPKGNNDEHGDDDELLLGVFDGHGDHGEAVADFLQTSFVKHLGSLSSSSSQPNDANETNGDHPPPPAAAAAVNGSTIRAALRNDDISVATAAMLRLFDLVATDLRSSSGIDCYISGSTACVAHIFRSRIIVANVGDTRAVLASYSTGSTQESQAAKGPRANVVTKDHTCQDEAEKDRILKAGGRVEPLLVNGEPQGPLRIFKGTLPYPGLVVTRSFGDDVAQKVGVISEPEVIPIDLIPEDDFLVIATDGLWDLVTPKQAVKILHQYENIEEGCKALVAHAMGISDGDNTTVLVHRFQKGSKSSVAADLGSSLGTMTLEEKKS